MTVLPRSIGTRAAFDNAMALDIAMGGSTNTILHLLAAAQEAELAYDLDDINEVSRRVPCLSKVAPNVAPGGTYYMEDVHRAAESPPSSVSSTAPACSTRTCTRCTPPPSPSG